jgi:hypothetical protein
MFKALLFASVIINTMLFSLWFYERKAHFRTLQKLSMCQTELQSTQENLIKYTQLYSELKSKCEIDKRKIEQRYTALLKKATEPIPQVSIPPHTDECEALRRIIDEASRYFSP